MDETKLRPGVCIMAICGRNKAWYVRKILYRYDEQSITEPEYKIPSSVKTITKESSPKTFPKDIPKNFQKKSFVTFQKIS